MADVNRIGVTVVQPGEGEYVALPGFGAVFKLSSKANGGEVSIVEHPFEVGLITAAHRHTARTSIRSCWRERSAFAPTRVK
jgi:hypothetical protein